MDFSGLVGADDPSERDRAELLWTAALGLKSTLLGFLLPLGILLLCYGSLGRLLSRHFGKRAGERRRQRRLLRVIATLVLAFFLCWLPYHTNKILDILVSLEVLPTSCAFERVLVLAHPYATCLAYANSCLNPLLYACCDPSFRRRCQGLLGRCRGTGGREEEKGKEASRSSGVQSGSESKQKSKREGEQDKVRRCKDQPDAEQYSETGHYSTLTLH
ncbi:APJB protein, partial [Atractosteus spatula]|nr:APJB protein [Atractosteus spatula]